MPVRRTEKKKKVFLHLDSEPGGRESRFHGLKKESYVKIYDLYRVENDSAHWQNWKEKNISISVAAVLPLRRGLSLVEQA